MFGHSLMLVLTRFLPAHLPGLDVWAVFAPDPGFVVNLVYT